MKFRRKLFLATAVLSAVAAMISCKKDEETGSSLPSLDNVPRFEVDSYVKCGTKVVLTPTKVTNATGAEVKYKWSITRGSDTVMSSRESEEDDGMSLEFVFEGAVAKDTLCNFIITCAAEATGYYGTSFSKVVTTVSDESLVSEGDAPELAYGITTGTVTADDGKTAYGTIKAGGLEWLAENIHFSGTAGAVTGVALEEAEDASDIFGRFYTWDEAQTACASLGTEWRVPAISDWDSFLTMLMDGEGDSQSDAEDSPVVWEGVTGKLMTNASLSVLTAILQCDMSYISRNENARALCTLLIKETVAVANAMGLEFSFEDVRAKVMATSENNKGGYTSIMMDIKNGRRTEVDTISGAVVRKADELDVAVPNMKMAVALVHALEGKSN